MVGRTLLRVPVSELQLGPMKLDKEASHYLTHVHRIQVGARFTAFDVESASEGLATVLAESAAHALVEIESIQKCSSLPRQRLILIQAFGKGSRVDPVVRDATVLDVSEMWVVSTARSALSSPKDTGGRLQRWRKIAVEAARQCGRGNVPTIRGVCALAEAFGSLRQFSGQKWLLSPEAADSLGERLSGLPTSDAALLVGPEGGFDDSECTLAVNAGFTEVRLGFRVLRSETAATAALGAIAAFRDR